MMPLARVLAVVCCGSLGYFASSAISRPQGNLRTQTAPKPVSADPGELAPVPESESAFIADWTRFRQAHGEADLPTLYLSIKDEKDAFRRRAYRAALIADWVTKDPAAALAFLQVKDSGQTTQLVREWMRIDPDGAINGLMAGGAKAQPPRAKAGSAPSGQTEACCRLSK